MPSGLDPVKLQRARELRREMMPEERMLWLRLRANQLGGFHFYRQKVLAGFIVDFCCPEVRLVVEVDGRIHEQHVEYDRKRESILQGHCWRVMRVSNDDVRHNTRAVLAHILAVCRDSQPPISGRLCAPSDATALPFPPRREPPAPKVAT